LLALDEAGEDDEGAPDDEGQAEADDVESDQGRYVSANGKVKLPDGSTVTVSELINGNLKDRDYRQKTTAHAEAVKAFEARSSAAEKQHAEVTQQRDYMVQLLESIVPKPPDPSQATTDPVGYTAAKAQFDYWVGHLQQLQAAQQRETAEKQERTDQQIAERRHAEMSALMEKAPDLKDEARANAFVKDIERYAEHYGYHPQDIKDALPNDHRAALVIRDALRYRKLQANKTKVAAKVEGRPPVTKGGNRLDPARAQARSARVAMDRLNQTGSLNDGVAALLAIEGKG